MKQIIPKTEHNTKKTGDLGETLACDYLVKHGYDIIECNYWRKWGELDIVAKKANILHFVEVKTVSYETRRALEWAVTHETWRPEEQVTRFKMHQIGKALETWISDHDYVGKWQIDIVGMRIVPRETYCTANLIENVILG